MLTVVVLLLSFPLLCADVVVLKNGGRVVGEVVKESDELVVVKVKGGTVEIPKDEVKMVIRAPLREEEKEEKETEKEEEKGKEKEEVEEKKPEEKEEPEKDEGKGKDEEKEQEEDDKREADEKEEPLSEEEVEELRTIIMQAGHPKVSIRRMGRARLFDFLKRFGKRAVPYLLKAVSSGNFWQRMNICDVLGHSGDSRALIPLLERLKDENKFVRLAAHNALKRLTSKSVDFNYESPTPESVKKWKKIVEESLKEEEEGDE